MQCPLCHHSMRDIEYEGALIRTCDGCGGEFIGASELALIVRRREECFPEAEYLDGAAIKPQFGIPESEKKRSLNCPACGSPMTVGNYGGDSGIYIDRCGMCGGVWLDADELENIQILMERWADEAPGQIAEIADELQAARGQAAASAARGFAGSRFAFINALINRLLDAA